ncbi:hypothetical protein ACIBF1_37525 [Spirillospora sp. NPDC050679]
MSAKQQAAMAALQDRTSLARFQGLFNIVGGAWPIVSRRSFEWVFGPKQDEWLQQTVGGLMIMAGWSQMRAAGTPEGNDHARRVGLGVATTLLAIDLIHVPRGRIRWTYLLDGAMEAAFIAAWRRAEKGAADS